MNLDQLDDSELAALHDAVHAETQARSERAAITRELEQLSRRWVQAGGEPAGVVEVLQQTVVEPEPAPVPELEQETPDTLEEQLDGPTNL